MKPKMSINASCRNLVRHVAGLDDAGLTVEHKRLIALARKLRKLMERK